MNEFLPPYNGGKKCLEKSLSSTFLNGAEVPLFHRPVTLPVKQ